MSDEMTEGYLVGYKTKPNDPKVYWVCAVGSEDEFQFRASESDACIVDAQTLRDIRAYLVQRGLCPVVRKQALYG